MKMGDSLLFIYLLGLYFTRARTSVLVMLTPGHGKGGARQPPLFPCQTFLCLSFCPDGSSVTSSPLRGQIGGCEEANVISAALGGKWMDLSPKSSHPALGPKMLSQQWNGPILAALFQAKTALRINEICMQKLRFSEGPRPHASRRGSSSTCRIQIHQTHTVC